MANKYMNTILQTSCSSRLYENMYCSIEKDTGNILMALTAPTWEPVLFQILYFMQIAPQLDDGLTL